MRRALLTAALLALVFQSPASSARADGPKLTATVGPGFSITLVDAGGQPVRQLDPGPYTIEVHDLSEIHSFHLSGPGVNERTEIETIGETTWNLTLVEGRYHYQCDMHPTTMKGDVTVGTPPPPPPPPAKPQRLLGTVGPGATISLKKPAGGAIVGGTTTIVVTDRSAKDNFHLTGPNVDRKTKPAGKGTVTWKVKLAAGKRYTYRSDASKALRRSFVPRAAG